MSNTRTGANPSGVKAAGPERAGGHSLTPEQRERLYNDNIRLADWAASKYGRPVNGLTMDDHVQTARLALWMSARDYEPSRGVQFATYAMSRIRGAVRYGGRQSSQAPVLRSGRPRAIREAERLLEDRGEPVNAWTLAEVTGLTIDEVERWHVPDTGEPMSLQTPTRQFPEGGATDAQTLEDRLEAEPVDPLAEPVSNYTQERVRRAIARLPEVQREVITGTWLRGESYERVGQRMGRTAHCVYQAERRALKRLRLYLGDFGNE